MRNPNLVPYETIVRATNGEPEAEKRITGDADPDLGKFLSFEEQPKDPAALQNVLRGEKHSRERLKSGDIKEHIETLSARAERKNRPRGRSLHRTKRL